MTDRLVVFVLGMGRSGTSALAGVLARSGLELPAELMAPNAANERGYNEPEEAVRLNDAFLAELGSDWFDPTFAVQEVLAEHADRLRERAAAFLTRELAGKPALVVKDPRISAYPEPWIAAARHADADIRAVQVFRDPRQVAASLRTRDGLNAVHSDLLWIKYNLLAELGSRAVPRAFVEFEALLADPRFILRDLKDAWRIPLAPDDAAIAAYLSGELRHHVDAHASDGSDLAALAAELLALLRSAAAEGAPATRAFDRLLDRLLPAERLLRPALRRLPPPGFGEVWADRA